MKQAIRERALELGFDDCRVTTAQRPESGTKFERWLQEERHGEMEYLRRNASKRLDPEQVLAGVKSILILAVSYASDDDLKSNARTLDAHAWSDPVHSLRRSSLSAPAG